MSGWGGGAAGRGCACSSSVRPEQSKAAGLRGGPGVAHLLVRVLGLHVEGVAQADGQLADGGEGVRVRRLSTAGKPTRTRWISTLQRYCTSLFLPGPAAPFPPRTCRSRPQSSTAHVVMKAMCGALAALTNLALLRKLLYAPCSTCAVVGSDERGAGHASRDARGHASNLCKCATPFLPLPGAPPSPCR